MKLKLNSKFFIFGFLIIFSSCLSKKQNTDISVVNGNELHELMKLVSQVNGLRSSIDTMNVLLLVVSTNSCSSCISEIYQWQNMRDVNSSITLIVETPFRKEYDLFIKANKITIPNVWDSASVISSSKFIIKLPTKLFLNKKHSVGYISSMGDAHVYKEFLEVMGNEN